MSENGDQAINSSRCLIGETGDDMGFVVVAEVLDDSVNVVVGWSRGGIGVPTKVGDSKQSFDGGGGNHWEYPQGKEKEMSEVFR